MAGPSYNGREMTLGHLIRTRLGERRNTPDLIAEVLREAVGRGLLQPGQALSQAELAAEFGVSPIPVREALRRLEADGLVALRHNRGAFVTELTGDDIRELYEIRLPLELQALRLAIPRLTKAELDHAGTILGRLDGIDDGAAWTVLDRDFHLALYRACGRTRLLELVRRLRTNTELYHSALTSVAQIYPTCQEAHRAILTACAAGRADAALLALEAHLQEAGECLARAVERLSP